MVDNAIVDTAPDIEVDAVDTGVADAGVPFLAMADELDGLDTLVADTVVCILRHLSLALPTVVSPGARRGTSSE